jgi:FMN-dependent NADH-azoreductase
MTNILVINSSAARDSSVSAQLTQRIVATLAARGPVNIVTRDVGSEPLAHLTSDTINGVRGEPSTPAERATRAVSDALIGELRAADLIVIGAPMYNFGIPSTLKAWFDHVLRAGVTFRYTAEGPEGLLKDKRAIVVETRGGLYSTGPAAAMDAQEPHLRVMLGFMGITDVSFVRAERLALDPVAAIEAASNDADAAVARALQRAA